MKDALLKTLAGLIFGFLGAALISWIVGESPLFVMKVMFESAFGSVYNFGLSLFYATPLIFTGLSVAIAFHAGLFNIGAEGQLALGALAATCFALWFPSLSPWLGIPLALLFGAIIGGFWGWIAGWLKEKRGSHEVITTIMLNFIAAAIVSWLVTKVYQSPIVQSPETAEISEHYFIQERDPLYQIFDGAPISIALLFAIGLAIGVWVLLFKTKLGFEIRALGKSESTAEVSGISSSKVRQIAMFLAGACASFVSFAEIIGSAGKYRLGFSPEYGFMGIAVALLARNNPIGILFSAFLFGALHKGAADLDIETEFVTRDLSLVIQSLILIAVAIAIEWKKGRRA
ncbi:MAG: ABC transporter permease [Oligoflexia bacterium]|nr:ABC transporter permease [Oligoflexia bacterium]